MGYIIPAGYSRVTMEFGSESPYGSEIVTGFGVNLDPGAILLDAVELWINEAFKLRLSSQYGVQRIEARNDVSVVDRTLAIAGTFPSVCPPPNTAALVRLGSGLVGRTNRGRMYLPGMVDESDVDSAGNIDPTVVTGLQGVMNYLVAALGDVSAQLHILHSDVGSPTLVTDVQVQPVVATQRRRLRA